MLDFAARLSKARSQMAASDIGLLFLPPGANLWYLTGIARHEEGGTDHNAYGDWAVGGYIGLNEGVTLVVPRMGGQYYQAEAQDKLWFESVRLIQESEEPLDVMRSVLGRFDLRGKKVALDDRVWARSQLALRRLLPDNEFVLASDILSPIRMIKEPAEIELMRQAGQITEQAFAHVLSHLKPGVTEIDVASEIDHQFKTRGAEHTSFVTGLRFVGAGRDRAAGAARSSEKRLLPGDSVTFDIGCVYQGYCSDFGRSAFVGEPPAEYLKVHGTVLRAQRAGMDAMRAGQATGAQVNAAARKVIEDEGYGPNFTHRLGHGIGITVHEPPWLDVVEQRVLQANMTFTVEPSIRVPDKFGNRVEDVVLVTEAGGVSLYNADRKLNIIA